MLFDKNDGRVNERIIYKTKPNIILGCKKAILGIVILVIILTVSPMVIRFIGEMQVYLISQIKLSLTSYAAIAFFVVILITVIYIIWQLIGWYSMEYTLTETKIIIKSGVISTKKNYMPYATIQDINTSQNILARLFNVGSVSVFSAYDNNQIELKDISNPSEVEEIIFSRMVGPRNFQAPPQQMPQYHERGYRDDSEYRPRDEDYLSPDDYLGRNDYYDEYEPITPITHEKNSYPRREYDYYPENFENMGSQNPRHTYEYEPYDSGFNKSRNTNQNNGQNIRMRDEPSYGNDEYYQNNGPNIRMRDENSYGSDDYYQNNEPQSYYDGPAEEYPQNGQDNVDASSQKVIQRHFDKFKK
ncbi:PH domain-containing protein [Methanobrevibacter sp.]